MAGSGCQQTWKGLTDKKKKKHFFDINKAFYFTKILKYPIVVNPQMKYSSQFQVPAMILMF